jgi:hypothetical protein
MTTYNEMPSNVRLFVWLFLASVLVTFAYIPLIPSSPRVSHAVMMTVQTVVFLIVDALFFVLVWLAAWRRKSWARWVLLLIFAIALVADFAMPGAYYRSHPFLTEIALASTILEAGSLYFIFTGNARAWFDKELPE